MSRLVLAGLETVHKHTLWRWGQGGEGGRQLEDFVSVLEMGDYLNQFTVYFIRYQDFFVCYLP